MRTDFLRGIIVLGLAGLCTAPGITQNVLKVPGQYKTIQAAIDAAQRYDTVLVDPGTYVENLVIKKNIWVKSSGGPYLTTIDGGGKDSVVWMELAKGGIDGFTILNGNAAAGFGGGIHTESADIIRNCIITGNRASMGGGIYLFGGCGTVVDNIIVGNTATFEGGGICYGANSGGGAEIYRNVIAGNQSSMNGGGVSGRSSNFWLQFHHNVVSNNHAGKDGGGLCEVYDVPDLICNVFFMNTAVGNGGGVYIPNGYVLSTLAHCTFVGNAALSGGGMCISHVPNLRISNTIFWLNRASVGPELRIGLDSRWPGKVDMDHSVVQGGQLSIHVETNSTLKWGAGMLLSDPLFVDMVNGDLHLTAASPCIGAGRATAFKPRVDFEWDPLDSKEDIGADEFYPHVYLAGTPKAGQPFAVRMVGPAAAPVFWGFSAGVARRSPPLTVPGAGLLHLPDPFAAVPVGRLSAVGVLSIPVQFPSSFPTPTGFLNQALVGTTLTAPLEVWIQ